MLLSPLHPINLSFQQQQQQQHMLELQQHRHQGRQGNYSNAEDNISSNNSVPGTTNSGTWSSKDPTPAQASALHNRKGGTQLQNNSEGRYNKKGRGGGQQLKPHRPNNFSSNNTTNSAPPDTTMVEHTGYLRMRGLPFTASARDVFDFFDETKPIEESIVFSFR